MADNYYQDPLGAPDYSAQGMPSLLSLSNLESLGRGSVAGLFDLPYVIEGMLRGDVDPRMPQRKRVVPSSEQVLATTPRMTQPTPQAGLLETAGAFMSPAPVAAVKPVAKAVGKAVKATEGMPVGMSIRDVSPKIGINVNQGGSGFADKIISGEKKFETRESDSLRAYVGKRVGIIRTGEGKAKAIGDVTLGEPIVISSPEEFAKLRDLHLVPEGSKFDIKKGGVKYLYPIKNPVPYGVEKDVAKYGIVSRKILGEPDTLEKALYPQQAALDLAQQRAALPVSEGGLGLPANNTPMDRARAMGFETPALHGSGTPNINAFDPNLVGTKAGNAFDNYMWFTSNPESASGYALNTDQFALIPEVKALNSQISQIGKDISSAYTNKNMDKVGELRKELNAIMKQKSDIYKDFEMGRYVSEGSTIYPVLLKTNQFMPYEAGGKNWMKANRPAIEESQSRGFQGVEIRNVKDNPNPSVGSLIADTYATENPDLIRSRFAAFDPFRKDVATATAMGVALPDLLAAEPTPQPQSSGLLYPFP